jgi:hypothetical protein
LGAAERIGCKAEIKAGGSGELAVGVGDVETGNKETLAANLCKAFPSRRLSERGLGEPCSQALGKGARSSSQDVAVVVGADAVGWSLAPQTPDLILGATLDWPICGQGMHGSGAEQCVPSYRIAFQSADVAKVRDLEEQSTSIYPFHGCRREVESEDAFHDACIVLALGPGKSNAWDREVSVAVVEELTCAVQPSWTVRAGEGGGGLSERSERDSSDDLVQVEADEREALERPWSTDIFEEEQNVVGDALFKVKVSPAEAAKPGSIEDHRSTGFPAESTLAQRSVDGLGLCLFACSAGEGHR